VSRPHSVADGSCADRSSLPASKKTCAAARPVQENGAPESESSDLPAVARARVLFKKSGCYLPRSAFGQAIDYALSNWPLLCVYLENGRLEIDNNLVENAIRPTAVGKKNWLFLGDADAGHRSAILCTIIESCRVRGIDPYAYLRDVLTRLPSMTNWQVKQVTPQAKPSGKIDLRPPTPYELGNMIRLPAQAAGLRFEQKRETGQRLDQALRDAAAVTPESLPLLEHVLSLLYEQQGIRGDGLLRWSDYEEVGELKGALAKHAEAVFSMLGPREQSAFPLVMRYLVTLSQGEEEVPNGQTVPYRGFVSSESDHDQKAGAKDFVDLFIEKRLLVADTDPQGEVTVRVAHEALLREWRRVKEWLTENREFLRMRDSTAKLWDAALGKLIAHQDAVEDATFGPDGARILTASADKTAKLWDTASGKLIASFTHQDGVIHVAFSPDGALILTASWDKTAKLWDAATPVELARQVRESGGDTARIGSSVSIADSPVLQVEWLSEIASGFQFSMKNTD
jgi:conflict system STAND superfamily ATPase/transposase IS66 family protein/transposase IS66-like protein/WD40 domain-containing protein